MIQVFRVALVDFSDCPWLRGIATFFVTVFPYHVVVHAVVCLPDRTPGLHCLSIFEARLGSPLSTSLAFAISNLFCPSVLLGVVVCYLEPLPVEILWRQNFVVLGVRGCLRKRQSLWLLVYNVIVLVFWSLYFLHLALRFSLIYVFRALHT